MASTASQEHTVKKGEKVQSIPKKHGHRDWKTIWNHKNNKKLAGLRKKPEQLQAGDKLFIPPSDEETENRMAALVTLQVQVQTEKELQKALSNVVARSKQVILLQDKYAKKEIETVKELVSRFQQEIRSINNVALGVDMAQALLLLKADVSKMIGKGAKSTAQMTVKEIAKHNDEIGAIAGKAISGVNTTVIKTIGSAHKKSSNTIVSLLGSAIDVWNKATSISYWSHTIVQVANGKSLTEAMKADIGDELKASIKQAVNDSNKRLKSISNIKKSNQAKVTEIEQVIKASVSRLAPLEKEYKEKCKAWDLKPKPLPAP